MWTTNAQISLRIHAVGSASKAIGYIDLYYMYLGENDIKGSYSTFERGLSFAWKTTESKKISNNQELIQSDPISCPQNQKGNN